MVKAPTGAYNGGMTYQVVVAAKDRNVVVKVDASNETTAKEIARWLVEHHQHLQAHVPVVKSKEGS
jgi:hypothetical protein